MEFIHIPSSDGTVMALRGAFTFKDHHVFRDLLDQLKTGHGPRHILDLSGLDFLDSAALGMLLIAEDEARKSGRALTLRKPSAAIAVLLELASMDTLFTIEK